MFGLDRLVNAATDFAEAVKPDPEAARIRAAAAAQRQEWRHEHELREHLDQLRKARARFANLAKSALTQRNRDRAAELRDSADKSIADAEAVLRGLLLR